MMVGSPRSRTIAMTGLLLIGLIILVKYYSATPTSPQLQRQFSVIADSQSGVRVINPGVVPGQPDPANNGGHLGSAAAVKLHPDVLVVPSSPTGTGHIRANCVPLPSSPKPGVIICTHSTMEDQFVSGALKKGMLWEGGLVFTMKAALETNPGMQLLDLGANIGEFTLFAAAMGRRVLAVDMLPKNVLAVQTSLQLSKLSPLVTIVQNALYRDHRSFGIKEYKGNIGGTALDESKKSPQGSSDKVMTTVLLDDLLPLVNSSLPAFMKLDIETSEHHAIVGGQNFLKTVDVPFIQMEWNHKPLEVRQELVNVLTQLGYVASKKCLTYEAIDMINFTSDMNVYFVKKSFYESKGIHV